MGDLQLGVPHGVVQVLDQLLLLGAEEALPGTLQGEGCKSYDVIKLYLGTEMWCKVMML